jgi:hypothetical protein
MRQFDAPIPGQSLTGSPKAYPWERPPEMVDPEKVVMYYLERLNQEEPIEGIIDALELESTVRELTEGILRVGVAEGLHSIDVSLIVAPVIHEFIKSVADDIGIEYDEGLEDKRAKEARNKEISKGKRAIMLEKLKKERQSGKSSKPLEGTDDLEQAISEVASPLDTEVEGDMDIPEELEAPKGLMARRSK